MTPVIGKPPSSGDIPLSGKFTSKGYPFFCLVMGQTAINPVALLNALGDKTIAILLPACS